MKNEEKTQENTEKPQETNEIKPKTSNSLLDETRALVEQMATLKSGLKEENDRLEKLKSEALLSGTAGLRPPEQEPKEMSPKEYAQNLLKGTLPREEK